MPSKSPSRRRSSKKRSKKGWRTASNSDPNVLYELSVQEPDSEWEFVDRIFRKRTGRTPLSLREDFCGTAFAAAAWVMRRKTNTVYAVDLSERTLAWSKRHHAAHLTKDQRARLHYKHGNVLTVSTPPVDALVAMNFSYFIWKTREQLVKYLRVAFQQVKPGGMIFLDSYGGYESFSEQTETRNLDGFVYAWETEKYNPITGEVLNHIHFRFPNGSEMKKAFTYDWRLWTLPEIQEALVDAGFVRPEVYWEGTTDDGEGDGIFTRSRRGEACAGWIAYIVASKPK